MDEILEGLTHTGGIEGSLIVGKDGLVISQAGHLGDLDTDLLGATAAEIYQSAESMMVEKCGKGALQGVMLEGENAKFFLHAVNEEALLLVATKKKANVGLARWEVRAAAGRLKDEL